MDVESLNRTLKNAIDHVDVERAEKCLKQGANVEHIDRWTMLTMTCFVQNLDLCKLMVKHGAKLDRLDGCGESALHWALIKNDRAFVDFLLESGADINNRNDLGNTPLHIAARDSHCELAEHLLSQEGIECEVKNNRDQTAYDLAEVAEIKEMILLKIHGTFEDEDNEVLQRKLAEVRTLKISLLDREIARLDNAIEYHDGNIQTLNERLYLEYSARREKKEKREKLASERNVISS